MYIVMTLVCNVCHLEYRGSFSSRKIFKCPECGKVLYHPNKD